MAGHGDLLGYKTEDIFDAWTALHPEPRPDRRFAIDATCISTFRYETPDAPRDYGLTFNLLKDVLVKRIDYIFLRLKNESLDSSTFNLDAIETIPK